MRADTAERTHLSIRIARIEDVDMDLKYLAESLAVRESNVAGSSFSCLDMADSSFEEVSLQRTRFSRADLSQLQISRSDLSGLLISECKTDEMTIDGIKVADLLAAYRQNRAA